MRFCLLLAALFLHLAPAQAAEKVDPCVLKSAVALMRRYYDHPIVYQYSHCLDNSCELGRRVSRILGGYVSEDDLTVLVIHHRDYPVFQVGRRLPKDAWDISLRGMEARISQIPWVYHAILEWHGQILDLDLAGGGEAVEINRYMRKMFARTIEERYETEAIVMNRPEDMVVRRIPLREYLSRYATRPRRDGTLAEYGFVLEHDPVPMRQFMRAFPEPASSEAF